MNAATPGQSDGLLGPLHALAAKWDANAARNQRNGQSLIDQGDEYGNEGLAVAEALGACVVELRAVLADAPEPQPAPGDAERLAIALAALRRIDQGGDVYSARATAEEALSDIADLSPRLRASSQPAPELAAARDASDLEVAAIIAERNQLRMALQRLADDGNLEARDRLAAIRPELTVTASGPAPELAAAKVVELGTAWRLLGEARGLLNDIGVMAANAPEDGDSFAVCEEIAMRVAAAGVPEADAAPDLNALPWRQGRSQGRNLYARTGGDDWKADVMIGQLNTPGLAAGAVRAHNAALGES